MLWIRENLMLLYGGKRPKKLARKLAVKKFGAEENYLLKSHFIGRAKGRRESKAPISKEDRKTFAGNL